MNASLPERKMVTTLLVKGNKMGLRDEALKKGLDEYRQRLESGGQTKVESEDVGRLDQDERVTDRLTAQKRRLKSLEWARRRMKQLYHQAKLDLGVAHGRRRRAERERSRLLEDIDVEKKLNAKLGKEVKVLSTQMKVERQYGRDAWE